MQLCVKRLRFWRLAVGVGFFCLVVIGMAMLWSVLNNGWDECSFCFVAQVNALGTTLEPGGSGMIKVPVSDADELILLPARCTDAELRSAFPGCSTAVIGRLLKLSTDDRVCPALIWLRDGQILSINPARFNVGLNLLPRSWKLRDDRTIKVKKELRSANSFLSLYFLEAQ